MLVPCTAESYTIGCTEFIDMSTGRLILAVAPEVEPTKVLPGAKYDGVVNAFCQAVLLVEPFAVDVSRIRIFLFESIAETLATGRAKGIAAVFVDCDTFRVVMYVAFEMLLGHRIS